MATGWAVGSVAAPEAKAVGSGAARSAAGLAVGPEVGSAAASLAAGSAAVGSAEGSAKAARRRRWQPHGGDFQKDLTTDSHPSKAASREKG